MVNAGYPLRGLRGCYPSRQTNRVAESIRAFDALPSQISSVESGRGLFAEYGFLCNFAADFPEHIFRPGSARTLAVV